MGNSDPLALSDIFSVSGLDGTLEAAFLLKPTGIIVAAWTRSSVPQEVISVMAATLWGSIDTMVRSLGGPGPQNVMVEVDRRRIFAQQVPPNWTLLLVAPRSEGKRRLRLEAHRIIGLLPTSRKGGPVARVEVEPSE